ncbi:MAG: thiamine phosphate synthase [Rhodobiaceae bacterium]|nr:thiamine phosphate synthase [Rhodobiaceae bacterium]
MTSKKLFSPTKITMTDRERRIDPHMQIANLAPGDALIFRHYELALLKRETLGRQLRHACQHRRVIFLVAGDPHLAQVLRADGIHVPRWLLRRGFDWHHRPKPNWHITAAAHNFTDLVASARSGIDACLLSPAFETASHPGAQTLGTVRFAQLAGQALLPVYALGGVNHRTAQRLQDTAIAGPAGISHI